MSGSFVCLVAYCSICAKFLKFLNSIIQMPDLVIFSLYMRSIFRRSGFVGTHRETNCTKPKQKIPHVVHNMNKLNKGKEN